MSFFTSFCFFPQREQAQTLRFRSDIAFVLASIDFSFYAQKQLPRTLEMS
jgi:hypothetical protein